MVDIVVPPPRDFGPEDLIRHDQLRQQHGLGRIYASDPQDNLYPMSEMLIPPAIAPKESKLWKMPTPLLPLDQDGLPQCVAYAIAAIMSAYPGINLSFIENHTMQAIYDMAQVLDEIPGVHNGTTVRAMMKVMQNLGLVSEYRWCKNASEVAAGIVHIGPVQLGIQWTEDMFYPDSTGTIKPTGAHVGGHSIPSIGWDGAHRRVRILNNWGLGWGDKGRAWISLEDLDILMALNGEAAIPIKTGVNYPMLHPVPSAAPMTTLALPS